MSDSPAPARLNAISDSFRPYQPSGLARDADGRAYLLARNETPFQPLASVVSAISGAAAEVNRYPDPACADLRTELAQRFDLPEDHITVGAGSVTFIQALFAATIEPGATLVYPWRSFELYSVLADLAGFSSVRVPLTSDRHDLDAMADAVDDRTRLVMICNPNNPTSTAVSPDDLDRFLGSLPPTCVVLLDEAYSEYSRHPGLGVRLLRSWPNLIVIRTFSKAYGLAGLRIGYMFAHPYFTSRIQRLLLPFSVSHVAQVAAIASLRAEEELLSRVQCTVAERERVRTALLGLGFEVPPSEANFVWLALGERTGEFTEACSLAGVNVQPFSDEGVRVSIGTVEDNDAFLAAAQPHRPRKLDSTRANLYK